MNSETCERLYNTYYMRVFSYIMTMAGDRHTAEEITQEVLKYYKNIKRNIVILECILKKTKVLASQEMLASAMQPAIIYTFLTPMIILNPI